MPTLSKSIFEYVTPPNKIVFLALVNLALFGVMPAVCEFYTFCSDRGDYPVNADSISIPIFGDAIALVILAPFVNIGAYILLRFAKLPARLVMPFDMSLINLLGSTVCVVVTGLLIYNMVDIICYAPPAGWLLFPPSALTSYLLWSARAGLLNRRAKPD